jgi:hypothetical protein
MIRDRTKPMVTAGCVMNSFACFGAGASKDSAHLFTIRFGKESQPHGHVGLVDQVSLRHDHDGAVLLIDYGKSCERGREKEPHHFVQGRS